MNSQRHGGWPGSGQPGWPLDVPASLPLKDPTRRAAALPDSPASS